MEELSKNGLKELQKLKQKKYRQETGKVLVEGFRTIRQILEDKVEILKIFVSEDKSTYFSEFFARFDRERIFLLKKGFAEQLTSSMSSQGIFALIETKTVRPQKWERLLLLDSISDPSNLGAIIRTAAACNIDGIILTSECCELFNPKVIRASVGKVFSIPSIEFKDFSFDNFGGEIIVTALKGEVSLFSLKTPMLPYILIVGSEAHGVSQGIMDRATKTIYIPMLNRLESLNAAVATGLCLYQLNLDQFRK